MVRVAEFGTIGPVYVILITMKLAIAIDILTHPALVIDMPRPGHNVTGLFVPAMDFPTFYPLPLVTSFVNGSAPTTGHREFFAIKNIKDLRSGQFRVGKGGRRDQDCAGSKHECFSH